MRTGRNKREKDYKSCRLISVKSKRITRRFGRIITISKTNIGNKSSWSISSNGKPKWRLERPTKKISKPERPNTRREIRIERRKISWSSTYLKLNSLTSSSSISMTSEELAIILTGSKKRKKWRSTQLTSRHKSPQIPSGKKKRVLKSSYLKNQRSNKNPRRSTKRLRRRRKPSKRLNSRFTTTSRSCLRAWSYLPQQSCRRSMRRLRSWESVSCCLSEFHERSLASNRRRWRLI